MVSRRVISSFAAVAVSLLGTAANAHFVWNTDHRSVWVTVYRIGSSSREIVRAECVQPGQRMNVAGTYGKGYYIRAEVTLNPNCAQPVQCDTTMETVTDRAGSVQKHIWYDFKTNPQTCWWDAFDDVNTMDLRRQLPMPYSSRLGPPPSGPLGDVRGLQRPLGVGEYIQSPGKVAYAVQQADGNLCVYRGTPAAPRPMSWCHHTVRKGNQPHTMVMENGELCSFAATAAGTVKTWCSGWLAEGSRSFFMAVTDDANLCVYRGHPGNVTGTVWCHNTNLGR